MTIEALRLERRGAYLPQFRRALPEVEVVRVCQVKRKFRLRRMMSGIRRSSWSKRTGN